MFTSDNNTNMENSSRFFKNTACSYFPCHKGLDSDEFNCLFCYCPLYDREVCPGNPSYIKKADGRIIKRCTDCTFPHKSENYERIMNLLRVTKNEIPPEEYHHGGEEKTIFDFSVNTNPLGLPERVKSSLKNALNQCEIYPDQNCTRLREKIACQLKEKCHVDFISASNIVCGNGASELISLLVQAISPKNALIVEPTFSGYERALKANGCKIQRHFLSEENDFAFDEKILDSIERKTEVCRSGQGRSEEIPPDMIFLCSPNNPTGQMISPDLLKKIITACEEKGIFLVVDECFIDFTERTEESALQFTKENSHLIVINAFTKIYAMAGLRLGYLVTSNQGILQKINSLRPEWNVSTLAQIAGESALDEKAYIEKTRVLIKEEREYLSKELKALGFHTFPSEANFILFSDERKKIQKDDRADVRFSGNNLNLSENLDKILLKQGFSFRNCGNFPGLRENFYRTAVRTHEENVRLIEILSGKE